MACLFNAFLTASQAMRCTAYDSCLLKFVGRLTAGHVTDAVRPCTVQGAKVKKAPIGILTLNNTYIAHPPTVVDYSQAPGMTLGNNLILGVKRA
jgi:hypothetical protein